MHKYLIIVIILLSVACSNRIKFKKTKDGLEYAFVESNDTAKKVKYGDVINIVMQIYAKDSLIFDTREIDINYRMRVDSPKVQGSIEEGFTMMHIGDSAIFITDAFNFFHYTAQITQPDFIKKGDKLTFYVRLLNILSDEDIKKEQQRLERRLRSQEQILLKDYLKRENINVKPTKEGLYFVPIKKTNGKKPLTGDSVYINYTLTLTNNMPIESTKNKTPYGFVYGDSTQIKGLNIGIGMMRQGEEAKLIIPSKLAFGNQRIGIIKPYTTLVFDVKLVKIKRKKRKY